MAEASRRTAPTRCWLWDSLNWSYVAMSADRSRIVAWGGSLYYSPDGGTTWARNSLPNDSMTCLCVSSDGRKLACCGSYDNKSGDIFTSSDGGATWVDLIRRTRDWGNVALSADGSHVVACTTGGDVSISSDSGATWTSRASYGKDSWVSVALSADGNRVVAEVTQADEGNIIYVSKDGGATWDKGAVSKNEFVGSPLMSADGMRLASAILGGGVSTSIDRGSTWTDQPFNPATMPSAQKAKDAEVAAAATARLRVIDNAEVEIGNIFIAPTGDPSWGDNRSRDIRFGKDPPEHSADFSPDTTICEWV